MEKKELKVGFKVKIKNWFTFRKQIQEDLPMRKKSILRTAKFERKK